MTSRRETTGRYADPRCRCWCGRQDVTVVQNTLWEGGTRTAAFIAGPGLQAGTTETRMLHVTDWYPTLAAAAGAATLDHQLDGFSVWPELTGAAQDWQREEIVYNIARAANATAEPIAAIRVGDWKYLWHVRGFDGWMELPEGEGRGAGYNPRVSKNR